MALEDLYQQLIMDHGRRPRNFRAVEQATHRLEGYNPLCGDRVTVYLKLDNGRVTDAAFQGTGCAISTASASLMTEAIKGKTTDEVEKLFAAFHAMVTGQPVPPDVALGKLSALAGVAAYPVRVKCATLPWHTMKGALSGARQPVSTE
ncbi:MAG: SUF system NifU family Fe-S cluster assembly protein [Bryobacterales bacterium]|nr:SUF system NifU family Fe-S cluster assembly protein [Bryobacteraceae bacterium]MDW8130440.1 SUF system NifU family Fe-S cluster assembly protein [Bryobacterales bacterium]